MRQNQDRIQQCQKKPKFALLGHIGILSPSPLSLEMESISIKNGALSEAMHRLPEVIENALPIAIGKIMDARLQKPRTRTPTSSPMTNYGDDDKHAYRELRRQLQAFGIRDTAICERKERLVEAVRSICETDGLSLNVVDEEPGDPARPEARLQALLDNIERRKLDEDYYIADIALSCHSR